MERNNLLNKAKSIILTTALVLSCLSVYGCAPNNGNTTTEEPTDSTTSATQQATQTATEANATQPATEADNNEATQPTTEASTEAPTQSPSDSSTTNQDKTQTDTPTTNTKPSTIPSTDENDMKLVEQTLVDDETSITVSGMLPEGAEMYIRFTNKDFMRMADNLELTIENEVSNPTVDELKSYKPAYNPIEFYSSTNWSASTQPLEADGVPCIEIYFAKGDELLEFESEFIVTAPIDFRAFATSRQSDFNMISLYLDNDQRKFCSTSVLSSEETPSNCFAFTGYTSGKYCFGNSEFINKYLSYYDLSMSQVHPYAERNSY